MEIESSGASRRRVALVAAAATFWLSAPAFAQGDLPRAANGRPDLNGIWQALNAANFNVEPHPAAQGAVETLGAVGAVTPGVGVVVGGSIPYRAEALAERQANFASRRTGDPEAKCFLPGVPRATYLPHPFQILQTDTDIMIVYQWAGAVRTIFMQDQIPAPVDSWMGWSNGRWEGDTLVVDVMRQNGQTWLDRSGNFLSADAHVTERYALVDPNHIEYEATIEDPDVFERSWSIRMPLYRRLEQNAQLVEFKCVEFAEEMMYGHLRKSAGSAGDSGETDD